MEERTVRIDYTNWRGERRKRDVLPMSIYWGSTSYHPKNQWLLRAIDLESSSKSLKVFALNDIHSWENPNGFREAAKGSA